MVTPADPSAASGHRPGSQPGSQPGLRERKKIRTRAAIRTATYRLIREQGYEATTVEQIAEAAEVSPSTVFRYFPAKEDIVLTDAFDPPGADGAPARPAGEPPAESLRTAVRTAVTGGPREPDDLVRLRARLMLEVPAVRARTAQGMSAADGTIRRALARRTGRAVDSLEVRVLARGLVGGLTETMLCWAEGGFREDLHTLVDRALDAFERGFDH